MMLPTDAAMTTRRSSLGGTLAGISLPYWLNAFPTLRLLRLVRPREQSRDCEEISEGVEEGAGGRVSSERTMNRQRMFSEACGPENWTGASRPMKRTAAATLRRHRAPVR